MNCPTLDRPHRDDALGPIRRHHRDVVDSTNRWARDIARDWPDPVHVVTADQQTAGRGREQRDWYSPIGGLWYTLAWRHRRRPADYALTPIVAALAVRQALQESINSDTQLLIKWPNDLLADNHKLAGILCENDVRPLSQRGCVLIGIGVNVNNPAPRPDHGLRTPATSLRQITGCEHDLTDLRDRITDRLIDAMRRLETHGLTDHDRAMIDAHLAYAGRTVRVAIPGGPTITGRLVGVADDGMLIVSDQSGERRISLGEIEHLRPAADAGRHDDSHDDTFSSRTLSGTSASPTGAPSDGNQ